MQFTQGKKWNKLECFGSANVIDKLENNNTNVKLITNQHIAAAIATTETQMKLKDIANLDKNGKHHENNVNNENNSKPKKE